MTQIERLRGIARHLAALELQSAGQALREAEAAGRHTNIDRLRVLAAQERWNLLNSSGRQDRGPVA